MPIKSIQSTRILLSPLNWGLGHVSRTIPIIQQLIEQNNEVLICCDEHQEAFYRHYFPQLWYIPHRGYPFEFKGNGKWTLDVVKSSSALYARLRDEKEEVKKLVHQFQPDLIISDQRYGFLSKEVKSVIISHQLKLPLPKWNVLPQLLNERWLKAFDEIWIPDNSNHQLSGDLSRKKIKKEHFIGLCSRFSAEVHQKGNGEDDSISYQYLGIVSGPFPYNQRFFELLYQKLLEKEGKSAIVVPKSIVVDESFKSNKIDIVALPSVEKFTELLQQSEEIISRAGYSTLMDLAVLGKKATLVPTPGQYEQLYLAELHKNHKLWRFLSEEAFIKE